MTWGLHWVSVRSSDFEDFLTLVFGGLATAEISVSISGLAEMFTSFVEHPERADGAPRVPTCRGGCATSGELAERKPSIRGDRGLRVADSSLGRPSEDLCLDRVGRGSRGDPWSGLWEEVMDMAPAHQVVECLNVDSAIFYAFSDVVQR